METSEVKQQTKITMNAINEAIKNKDSWHEIVDKLANTFVSFEKELTNLIKEYSIEHVLDMPDFLIAKLLVGFLKHLCSAHGANKDFHSGVIK